jgi:hypothetical protein
MADVIDVTDMVDFGNPDDECLPMTKCVCGHTWEMWGGFMISIYKNNASECPNCHRKLYFRQAIRVYQIEE